MKNQIRIKRAILILISISLIGIFTACSSKKESDGSSVRVAFFPNITHSQALIGKAGGQFQKALGDINIEWKQFNAGALELEALLAGAVDIGYIGPGPAINGYAKSNGDIKIIAGATDAGAILVSRKDLNIKEIKELDGKKVAIPQYGNTQDLCLRYLLRQNGLKESTKGGTVEIVQAENPDIKMLLDRGDIDAALVPEPWGARLVKEVGANIVLDYDQIWREGKYPTAIVVVRKDFLEKYPDIVEKFLRAHVELTDYMNTNQDKGKETINNQIKELTQKALARDVLDNSFKRITVTNDPEKQAISEMVKLSVNTGFLREEPDLKDFFSLDILNKILREKGQQEIE